MAASACHPYTPMITNPVNTVLASQDLSRPLRTAMWNVIILHSSVHQLLLVHPLQDSHHCFSSHTSSLHK